MTITDLQRSAAEERRAAFAARGDLELFQRGASAPLGAARSLAFGAQMRATKREWNGKQMYNLVGIASVTDQPYEMYDMFGPYDEIIDRGAFTDTLAADPDVAFLLNHKGLTMARTRAKEGSSPTLTLRMVDEGLESDAWVNPARQDVKDLVIAIDDGNIDQMSFAFMLEEGWWSEDFSTFKITKLDMDRGDTSAVNYGANPYTSINARSREILSDLTRLPAGAKREAIARLTAVEESAPVKAPEPSEARSDLTGRSTLSLSAWIAAAEDQ